MDSVFPVSVCIAAPTGIIASSLRTFLSTIPEVQVVFTVGLWQELETFLEEDFGCTIILDADLALDQMAERVKQLTRCHPSCLIVALVNTSAEQHIALVSGARSALLKGNLGEQLRQAVLEATQPHPTDFAHGEKPG